MYIFHNHNLAYIAHPKTASAAMANVLEDLGAILKGAHHHVKEEWCRPILDGGGLIMSTVRNPFDSMVSWYFHYKQRRKGAEMEPFVEWLPQQLGNPNQYIHQGLFFGLPWTNRTLRFENLQADFDQVMTEVGIGPIEIPVINVSKPREGRPYQEMYNDQLIQLVRNHFGSEIANHGYSF